MNSNDVQDDVIPVKFVRTERTVRIMWTDDEVEKNINNNEIIDPMYLSLESSKDIESSFLKYAQTQMPVLSDVISFAEILEVESTSKNTLSSTATML